MVVGVNRVVKRTSVANTGRVRLMLWPDRRDA